MIALLVDLSVSQVADIVSRESITATGIATFVGIAVVFSIGQYYMLNMVKARNRMVGFKPPKIHAVEQLVTFVQYILIGIVFLVVLQILSIAHYYTNLLTVAVTLSYGLASLLMGILSYRLFAWYKLDRALVVLMYALAAAAVTVNAIDSLVFFDVVLLGKPMMVSPQSPVIFQVGFNPGTPMSVVEFLQSNSMIAYFVFTWAGTVLLMRHYVQRIGKVKFWVLVTVPLIYFMSYYISLYQTTNPNSPVTAAVSSNLALPILLYTYSIIVCGILFGIGFRSVASSLAPGGEIRDYMIITAIGFILLFSCGQATVLQAGYPPFGLANVSFVGFSSFMILIGLYYSAVSVAHDGKLRKFIKESALSRSKLLGSIGTAQMHRDIEEHVVSVTRRSANTMREESGIESTLDENEIKRYINEVLQEVHGKGNEP